MESLQATKPQPDFSWPDRIAYLAWKMNEAGGAKPDDFPVKHIFEPGRYIREFELPGNMLFLGRVHTVGHIVLLCWGEVDLITESGTFRHIGPDAIYSSAGFQTVAHILQPSLVRSIHPNPENIQDHEVLEKKFFGPVNDVLLKGQSVQAELLRIMK